MKNITPNQASRPEPAPAGGSGNFLVPAVQESGGMMDVASSRAAQEVQAAMVVAKKFPRNEIQAIDRIRTACMRPGLAELAMYAYPRGGQTVTGPSIRLAEVLAKSWGNIDVGVIELEQRHGESSMMAYAWDLETNTRSTRIFTVKHERKAQGAIKVLDDPRDIYEMTANQGARRLRACILAIIPIDVQDTAVQQCEKTLAGKSDKPLKDRVTDMVLAFKEHGVTESMIEKRLGHRLDATIETELVTLRKIFMSIRDNMAPREQYFEMPTAVETAGTAKAPVHGKARQQAEQIKTGAVAETTAQAAAAPQTQTQKAPSDDGDLGPQTPDPLFDSGKPYESISAMMERDEVIDEQVVKYAKGLKLCGDKVEEVMQLREAVMAKLCENWQVHLPKIREITGGE